LPGLDLPSGVRATVIFNGDFEIFPGGGHERPGNAGERLQSVARHIGQHDLKIIVHELLILFLGVILAAVPAA
jgi:hypothetical protein